MASKARKAFDQNAKDVDRLLEIHQAIGGDAPGRKHRLEVLNKSAIVLITAFWEAYCEDLASEALAHIVANVPDASKLPKELKKKVAKEIKDEKNEIAAWDLADRGWHAKVTARLATYTQQRNWDMNTPKANKVDDLFETAIGLPKVSDAWKWKRMSVQKARTRLDDYVTLRGSVAHRGAGSAAVHKAKVEDFFNHVKTLASKTGGRVNRFVKDTTGKALW
jgi:hypothetical protein